jgi:2-(3-amino-3-carboxypropyl)histidine synthase
MKELESAAYDLDLKQAIDNIKQTEPKRVCLQFPDGLKEYSGSVYQTLQDMFPDVTFFIYLGSCFGGCDLPPLEGQDIDLLIQWGHNEYII